MGWQTNVITQLVFNKETYNTLYSITEEIERNKKVIQNITEELLVMTTSRPEDLLLHNDDMDLIGLQREVKDKLECLSECIIENFKLEHLKYNFNLRNGDFIENPDRKEKIKKWLIDNYILEESDFCSKIDSCDSTVDINAIEGD